MTSPQAQPGFSVMANDNHDIVLQECDASGKVRTRVTFKAGADYTVNFPLLGSLNVIGTVTANKIT